MGLVHRFSHHLSSDLRVINKHPRQHEIKIFLEEMLLTKNHMHHIQAGWTRGFLLQIILKLVLAHLLTLPTASSK